MAQQVKNGPAIQAPQEMPVQSLSWEDPPEEEMATQSSILPWQIPWTEEPGGLQSTGSWRAGHDWATKRSRACTLTHTHTHTHTRVRAQSNEILRTILSESIAKMWWKSTSSIDQIFVQTSVSPEVLLIRGKGRVKGKWWQEHRCLFILVVYTDWRFSTCHTSYIYFIFFSLCWVSHTVLFLVN